jgi:hypothetical protein
MRLALVLLAFLLAPLAARAQCTKDTDCKGDRICEAGRCVSPAHSPAAATRAQPPAPPPIAPPPPPPPAPAAPAGPVAPAVRRPANASPPCASDADCSGFTTCRNGECVTLKTLARCASAPSSSVLPSDYHPLQNAVDSLPSLEAANRTALFSELIKLDLLDDRGDPCSLFGRGPHGRELHTHDDVPRWTRGVLTGALIGYRLTTVETGQTLWLTGTLLKAMVEEGKVFAGDVSVRFELRRSPSSAPVWIGVVDGRSRRWGRTGRLELYLQALGAAVTDVARNLLDDPGFLNAVNSTAAYRAAAPVAPPPAPLPTAPAPAPAPSGPTRKPVNPTSR